MKTYEILPLEKRDVTVPLNLYLKAVEALQLCEEKLIEVCKHGQGDDLRKFCGLRDELSLTPPVH